MFYGKFGTPLHFIIRTKEYIVLDRYYLVEIFKHALDTKDKCGKLPYEVAISERNWEMLVFIMMAIKPNRINLECVAPYMRHIGDACRTLMTDSNENEKDYIIRNVQCTDNALAVLMKSHNVSVEDISKVERKPLQLASSGSPTFFMSAAAAAATVIEGAFHKVQAFSMRKNLKSEFS